MNIIIYDHVYIDLLYSNIMGQTLFRKDDSNRQPLVKSNAGFLRKAWSPYIHAGGRGWGLRSRILGGKQGIETDRRTKKTAELFGNIPRRYMGNIREKPERHVLFGMVLRDKKT